MFEFIENKKKLIFTIIHRGLMGMVNDVIDSFVEEKTEEDH